MQEKNLNFHSEHPSAYNRDWATKSPPVTKPKPSPAHPKPEKTPPSRKISPRPGHTPRPVIDPKNYPSPKKFQKQYYRNSDATRNTNAAIPFTEQSEFEQILAGVKDDERNLNKRKHQLYTNYNSYHAQKRETPNPIPEERELPTLLQKLESPYSDQIPALVHRYMRTIFGERYEDVKENLTIQYRDPYEFHTNESAAVNARSNAEAKLKESTEFRKSNPSDQDAIDIAYLNRTLLRSELHSFFVQGFGILHMQGYYHFEKHALTQIHPLFAFYNEEFDLNGRKNHIETFLHHLKHNRLSQEDEHNMEENKSLGRIFFQTNPVTDAEGQHIQRVDARAEARSSISIVLVHESIKGIVQLLTPWAKVYENYLSDQEIRFARDKLSSFWAEIRQFVIGPIFIKKFLVFLSNCSIPSNTTDSELYLAIQNFVLMDETQIHALIKIIFQNSDALGEKDKAQWREKLLCPLEDVSG